MYDFESRKEEKIELGGDSMGTFNISDISGDGERLLCFGAKGGGGLNELYLVDIKEQKRTQLTDNKLTEWGGVFSLDEKWVAYTSEKDMEGSYAIYLNRFPEMDKEIRISNGGGEEPKFFEGDYVNVWGPSHDIFPDGRILLLKGEEWVPPTEIDVIINALDLAP